MKKTIFILLIGFVLIVNFIVVSHLINYRYVEKDVQQQEDSDIVIGKYPPASLESCQKQKAILLDSIKNLEINK